MPHDYQSLSIRIGITMSNFVYGYIATSNKSALLDEIRSIMSNQTLGFIVDSPEHLYNFPTSQLPQSDDVLVFNICDSKNANTASILLESLDFVVDTGNGLLREARDRRKLLLNLISGIFKLKQVEKIYVALTEIEEIEAVVTISLTEFIEAIANNYDGPPNILYIIEKGTGL